MKNLKTYLGYVNNAYKRPLVSIRCFPLLQPHNRCALKWVGDIPEIWSYMLQPPSRSLIVGIPQPLGPNLHKRFST
jgi:hypothetical protein